MKIKSIIYWSLLATAAAFTSSCKMDPIGIRNTGNFADTTGTLKGATAITIGFGIDYAPFMNNSTYTTIVAREGKSVTFGYQMKHGAIVQDNGSLDFTKADALYDAATSAGLEVYGHTLGWHANQNANYLKTYAKIVLPAATELLTNPGFELGTTSLSNWSTYNSGNPAGTSTITVGSGSNEVRTGTRSMKVINPVGYPGSQWRVQVASDLFNTTVGKDYIVSYWVKAASAGGSIRLSTSPTAQYQGDQTIGTSWAQITWTINAKDAQTRILFDMGQAANTYYIDDVSVKEVVPVPSGQAVVDSLTNALNKFITTTVTHYKGKVKAWDVINEMFADNGAVRNNSNTTAATDVLVWSNYLGKDFGVKAFTYAKAADPSALLFINDYGLESNSAKVDSLIAYVSYLKAKGCTVDGIGTQMHIAYNTSYTGIDAAFQKLAATGLKIRISEFDVRANPFDKSDFTASFYPYALDYQADMYKYVIDSYLKYVPAAQRHGITIWGVDDPNSWIIINQKKIDAPLLFNANFAKKPAYSAVLQAIKGQ